MAQSPGRKYRVTLCALDDLKNIGRYTEKTWGKNQRNIYLNDFATRFQWFAENPLLGKHRTDVCEGYYSFPQGQHAVFYLIGNSAIDILGVPHKEMDIISYFQDSEIDEKPTNLRHAFC